MQRLLVLFASSFPFGPGETFLAAEFAALEKAFDEIIVISNDVSSPQTWTVGSHVSCRRVSYELSRGERILALRGLLLPSVAKEFMAIRRRHPDAAPRRVLSTILVSWEKARKFARLIREISSSRDAELYGYSYWANDMAIAIGLARRQGLLRRAVSRAHGWDVYTFRREVGFLPFRQFLANQLDSIAFVSEDGRRFFETSVGRGRARLDVLPLGTNEEATKPLGRGEKFTVVSCSSLIPLKRLELLARAVARVERPIRWVHVGDGPERARIESACAGARPGTEITFMGHLSHREVMDRWRQLRPSALFNVSETEGLPVSMMEAMSLGIPVIGTRVGGVAEIVSPGVNGYLLSPDPDPEEIVTALETVATLSDSAFEVLAQGAWHTWNQRFRADRNYARSVDLMLGSGSDGDAPGLRSSGSPA